MSKVIWLDNEFEKIWNKVIRGENFAFARYGDGERALMMGWSFTALEGWQSPCYVTNLGKALLDSLCIEDKQFYYGISCPCCDSEAYFWYKDKIINNNITFANIWVNNNYKKFKNQFWELKRDAVLIANYRAETRKIGNINILKHYKISDNCVEYWDNEIPQILENVKKDFRNCNDLLYVISAGPVSEPLIAALYRNNPNNCYIDFGSSIDNFYYENPTREYMIVGSKYSERNCWMYENKELYIN